MKKIVLMLFVFTGFFHALDAMERDGETSKEYADRLLVCKDILSRKLPDCSPTTDQDFNERILLLTEKVEALSYLELKIKPEEKKPYVSQFDIERDKWQEQIRVLKAEQEKRAKKRHTE